MGGGGSLWNLNHSFIGRIISVVRVVPVPTHIYTRFNCCIHRQQLPRYLVGAAPCARLIGEQRRKWLESWPVRRREGLRQHRVGRAEIAWERRHLDWALRKLGKFSYVAMKRIFKRDELTPAKVERKKSKEWTELTSLVEAGENLESWIDLVKKSGWGQTPQDLGAGLEQLLAGSHASFILSPWVAWYSARLVLRKFLLNEFTLYTVRETDLNKNL